MPLTQATLQTELENIGLHSTVAAAQTAWAHAYRVYFEDSALAGSPPLSTALDAAESAMDAALSGLNGSSPDAVLQTGITAFWAALVANTPVYGPEVLITPPPALGALAGALNSTFAINLTLEKSVSQAAAAVAANIHTASQGGTGTVGVTPVPIL